MARLPRHRRLSPSATLDAFTAEPLEARTLLTAFTYHDLASLVDVSTPLYVLSPGGDGSVHTIGSAVDSVGDINGDGFADVLVGAGGRAGGGGEGEDDDDDGHGHSGHHRAVAAIYSGHTGALLFSFEDGFTEFGSAVAGVGDVTGDHVPDFVVGSPRFDTSDHGPSNQVGRVYLYSGANGQLVRSFTGASDGDRFGAAVSAAGDFNGDGTPDIIVGAPGADGAPGAEDRGQAFVYSGSDGALLATFTGASDEDALGYSVGNAGDVNGDGRDDVIVGAPGPFQGHSDTPGHAYVYSGADHAAIMTLTGDEDGDWFGFSVDGVGDINNDGRADVIVGAPSARNTVDGNFPSAGVVRVYSGATGDVLFLKRGSAPNNNMGAAVAGAGDVDRDGRPDFIVGAPAASPAGHVGVYSGANGRMLARFSHTTSDLRGGDRLGTSVAAIGDANGDGFMDFVFGATQDANPERNDRGRMYVFSGAGAASLMPDGLNDDRDIWGSSGGEGFLILNGQLFLLPTHPGFLHGDRAVDVNMGDTVLGGTDAAGSNAFIWRNGARTSVASLVTSEDGPAGTYTGMRAVDITDSGLILVERLRDGTTPTVWLLDNGVLHFLFNGVPVAMNEARTVIGVSADTSEFHTTVWTPDHGASDVNNIRATDINENNDVVGTSPAGVVVLSDGSATPTPITGIPLGTSFAPTAISNSGEIVGTYRISGATSGFYYRPGDGMLDIKPLVNVGAPPEFAASADLRLADINNRGGVVGGLYDVMRGFLLDRRDGQFHANPDRRVQIVTTADGVTTAATVSDDGDVIIFQRDSSGTITRTNLSQTLNIGAASDVVIFVDPGTHKASVAATTDDGLVLLEQDGAQWRSRNLTAEIPGATVIIDSLFALTPQNGLVIVGGRNADGDVVIYGMTSSFSDGRRLWTYDNLSQSQLRDHGLTTPDFQPGLVAYVTPWNGLNIAGVDVNGHVRVFWTAPGVQGWHETDLSTIAIAPTLVGPLTVYIAPWGGINVVGTDASGHLLVIWWVPAFAGTWAKNDFTSDFGGPSLRAESMTSYVTPWNGFNIAGLTDDGRVVVYWWVPSFGGQWSIDEIRTEEGDDRDRPSHRLTSHVAPDGTFHLAGVGRFGDVVDMRWDHDHGWHLEDFSGDD